MLNRIIIFKDKKIDTKGHKLKKTNTIWLSNYPSIKNT